MRSLIAALAACAFVACSQAITPEVPEGVAGWSARPLSQTRAEGSGPVYVLGGSPEAGPEIIGYGVTGHTDPLILSIAGLLSPAEIAIDGRGIIYVGDTGTESHQASRVAEYKVGHNGALRVIKSGIAYPYGIAVSAGGELYVANAYGGAYGDVAVYQKDSVKPSLVIRSGIDAPSAVAVDTSGFVYVGNQEPTPYGNVQEYAPKAKNPALTLTDEISDPLILAVDGQENLYVANWAVANSPRVTEYGPQSASPMRTLNVGSSGVITSLAVDGLGNVYAGVAWNPGVSWYGKIVIFGSTGQKALKTIPLGGGNVPTSIAIDAAGDLYALVGNGFGANGSSYLCNVTCSLWEYSDAWKTRTLIARSKKGSKHYLTGPIVIGLK